MQNAFNQMLASARNLAATDVIRKDVVNPLKGQLEAQRTESHLRSQEVQERTANIIGENAEALGYDLGTTGYDELYSGLENEILGDPLSENERSAVQAYRAQIAKVNEVGGFKSIMEERKKLLAERDSLTAQNKTLVAENRGLKQQTAKASTRSFVSKNHGGKRR